MGGLLEIPRNVDLALFTKKIKVSELGFFKPPVLLKKVH